MATTTHGQPATSSAAADREADRLRALGLYGILGTIAEPEYDEAAALAADLCQAPMATIGLLSEREQWFKAAVGVPLAPLPREHVFCRYALGRPRELLVVPDAAADPRFRDDPLVAGHPRLRAYLGAPLTGFGNHVVGTVAVLDVRPRAWTASEGQRLETVARLVMSHLELRRVWRP